MTKLEAVQQIVSRAGLGIPHELNTGAYSDAGLAEKYLDEEDLKIQGRGWHYNIERDVEIAPNASSNIVLPEGTITIDTDARSAHKDYVQRGQRMYDRRNNTFTITDSVRVTRTVRFEFDCIPDPVARFIAMSAAARFNQEHGHTDPAMRDRTQQFIERDMRTARLDASRWNSKSDDTNVHRTYESAKMRGEIPLYGRRGGHGLD